MVVAYASGRLWRDQETGWLQPFRELGRMGAIPLGHAVETSAGALPFKAINHVAGIEMLGRSSERSIRDSVQNSLSIARNRGHPSVALPMIGAGSGGKPVEDGPVWICGAFSYRPVQAVDLPGG